VICLSFAGQLPLIEVGVNGGVVVVVVYYDELIIKLTFVIANNDRHESVNDTRMSVCLKMKRKLLDSKSNPVGKKR